MKKIIALAVLSASLFGGQLGVDGGRFVFGQVSEMRADQYLLDTQSGQMWRMVKSDGNATMLEPVQIGNFIYNKNTTKMDYTIDFIPVNPYVTLQDTSKKK